jgi:hypothetical protein
MSYNTHHFLRGHQLPLAFLLVTPAKTDICNKVLQFQFLWFPHLTDEHYGVADVKVYAAGEPLLVSTWGSVLGTVLGTFAAALIVLGIIYFVFVIYRPNGWDAYLVCNTLTGGPGVAQPVQCLIADWTNQFDPRQRQRIFPLASVFRPALRLTQLPIQWVSRVLSPGVKRGRGVTLTTHPLLVPRSRMSRSYTSSPPWLLHNGSLNVQCIVVA